MKFFFDNNLASKIAKGLKGSVVPDHQEIHLKEQFPANTDDVDWMGQLAEKEDLIIVTADDLKYRLDFIACFVAPAPFSPPTRLGAICVP